MNAGNRRLIYAAIALTVVLFGCSSADKNMAPAPTPAPVAAPAPPPPPMAPAPTYVIEGVNFDFNRSNLKPAATETLDRVASELRAQPEVRYEVAGFTDSVNADAYNQAFSERRAGSVNGFLVYRGVDDGQLSMHDYGETNPVAGNDTKEGRAKNRRVEIRPIR